MSPNNFIALKFEIIGPKISGFLAPMFDISNPCWYEWLAWICKLIDHASVYFLGMCVDLAATQHCIRVHCAQRRVGRVLIFLLTIMSSGDAQCAMIIIVIISMRLLIFPPCCLSSPCHCGTLRHIFDTKKVPFPSKICIFYTCIVWSL